MADLRGHRSQSLRDSGRNTSQHPKRHAKAGDSQRNEAVPSTIRLRDGLRQICSTLTYMCRDIAR